MNDKKQLSGVAFIAASAASFAFLPIFAKLAYAAGSGIYTLLFFRFSIAAACMFLLLLILRRPLPQKKNFLHLLLLGGVGYGLVSFCCFSALRYVSSGTASLLLYTYPAFVMLGSAIFLKEKITAKKILSLCLALAGAVIIVGADFKGKLLGIVFAALSGISYAAYILISSRVVKKGREIESSAVLMLGAAIVYAASLPFAGFEPPKTAIGVLAAVLVALVSTAIAFVTFFIGMEKTSPTVASLVSILEPVITVFASAIILSEKITMNIVLGGLLVLFALIVTILPQKEKAA